MTASPSPTSSLVSDQPSLARLARLIHQATTDDPVTRVVYVEHAPAAEASDLGFWDVPQILPHPVDPLIGWIAPSSWDAVGLISSGRLRHLDQPDRAPERTLSTFLLGRDGTSASAIGPVGGEPRLLEEPPTGLVPDVLKRVLGLPTPAPEDRTGAFADLTWLDELASGVLGARNRIRAWRWLADRHPLRGTGPTPSPEELAARTAAYSEERSWAGLRLLAVTQDLPAVRFGPPGGSRLPGCEWFDDGSLSRWLLSRLPPAEALVPDLLSVLPHHVGADLLTALGEVDGTWPPVTRA